MTSNLAARLSLVILVLLTLPACNLFKGLELVNSTKFGVLPGADGKEGTEIKIYTLTNKNGIEARLTNYGATLVSLKTPDKDGKLDNIVLGFDTFEEYLQEGNPYFGCTVGRYANRIAKGKFTLNGKEYTLATNNGENHLHGGIKGYDKVVWKAVPLNLADLPGDLEHKISKDQAITFAYKSSDMEEGYPGNVAMSVTYVLTDDDELRIEYHATTDQATPINLTNHSYWNLSGQSGKGILDHEVMINAPQVLAAGAGLIPTGELASVSGTPLDFTTPHAIGSRISQITQKDFEGGYDHCFVLADKGDKDMVHAATVTHPGTGRVLEIYTSEPAIQFYTGNFLDGSLTGSGGIKYEKHHAFCLETQKYPDSPNHANFPSSILKPGEIYRHTTVHKFSAK